MNSFSLSAQCNYLVSVADAMCAASITAPKAMGNDNIRAFIFNKSQTFAIGECLVAYGQACNESRFIRDGKVLKDIFIMVVIATMNNPMKISNCRRCGYINCNTKPQKTPCVFNLIDLGIAVGSAVSVAANARIDNRVMMSCDEIVLRDINPSGILPKGDQYIACCAIPLSISSKSPFFDRR